MSLIMTMETMETGQAVVWSDGWPADTPSAILDKPNEQSPQMGRETLKGPLTRSEQLEFIDALSNRLQREKRRLEEAGGNDVHVRMLTHQIRGADRLKWVLNSKDIEPDATHEDIWLALEKAREGLKVEYPSVDPCTGNYGTLGDNDLGFKATGADFMEAGIILGAMMHDRPDEVRKFIKEEKPSPDS